MNQFYGKQNASVACEDVRSSFLPDRREALVCPKPRKVGSGLGGLWINNYVRPLRAHMSREVDICNSNHGMELLDMILTKEGNGSEESMICVASSPPPFFCGSPPGRSANPLTQDARFGDVNVAPLSPLPIVSPSGFSSPSSSTRKGGCNRTKFALKPAAVRVEGFDCLNRDCQNSRVPAVA